MFLDNPKTAGIRVVGSGKGLGGWELITLLYENATSRSLPTHSENAKWT